MSPLHTSISRRRFIANATAAVAAPTFIPRYALGDDSSTPANDKINLALVGMGYMMRSMHFGDFLNIPEIKIVAVCDVDKNRRDATKSQVDGKYGTSDCQAYVDHTEIMARDDIDAVVCATPDHWHAIVALDAIKAGKDLYCEKPLTNNLVEAKAVMDAAAKSDIIFQAGSQQRASDNFRYACELVRNGRLGKIKKVEVGVGGPPMPCKLPGQDMEPNLDWNRWLGPAPMRPYSSVLSPRGVHNHFPSWRAFCEYGGGAVTDFGAHHFDIAQWGLGMDKSGPVEIVLPENPKRGRGVKFIYDNGVEVIHGGENGITFYGSEGQLFANRGQLVSTPGEIIKQPIAENEIHLYDTDGDSWHGHRRDWINCIKSRKQPNCPAEVGARTIAVCHLGNIAYLHAEELAGKSLKWDPIKWEFTNNDAANAWRDYPYPRRKGFELPTV